MRPQYHAQRSAPSELQRLLTREYRTIWDRILLALQTAPGLRPSERQIGTLMLRHTNGRHFIRFRTMQCWPSEDLLACLSGLSPSAVRKARRALRSRGALKIDKQGGFGPGDTTYYVFDMKWVESVERVTEARIAMLKRRRQAAQEAKLTAGIALRGDAATGEGVGASAERGDGSHPESIESTLEEPDDFASKGNNKKKAPQQRQFGEIVKIITDELGISEETATNILMGMDDIYGEISALGAPPDFILRKIRKRGFKSSG